MHEYYELNMFLCSLTFFIHPQILLNYYFYIKICLMLCNRSFHIVNPGSGSSITHLIFLFLFSLYKMVPILPVSLSGPPIIRLRVLRQEVESISGPLGWPPDLPWPTECRGSDSIPVPSASIRPPPPHAPLPQGTVPLPAEQVQLSLLAEEGLRSTELNQPLSQLKPQAPDGAQPRASRSGASPTRSQSITDTRVSPVGSQL